MGLAWGSCLTCIHPTIWCLTVASIVMSAHKTTQAAQFVSPPVLHTGHLGQVVAGQLRALVLPADGTPVP